MDALIKVNTRFGIPSQPQGDPFPVPVNLFALQTLFRTDPRQDDDMVHILTTRSEPYRIAAHRQQIAPMPAHVAAFCAFPGGPLDSLLSDLTSRGVRVSTFPLRQLPLDWFDRYASSFDLALIDTDFLGDKVEMIDFGMRLRRFAPDLPLVMLSSRIAASDRSTERMAFCDVTLRLPLPESELMESFSIALENHAYWRDSRHEARLLQPRKHRASTHDLRDGAPDPDARDDPPHDG